MDSTKPTQKLSLNCLYLNTSRWDPVQTFTFFVKHIFKTDTLYFVNPHSLNITVLLLPYEVSSWPSFISFYFFYGASAHYLCSGSLGNLIFYLNEDKRHKYIIVKIKYMHHIKGTLLVTEMVMMILELGQICIAISKIKDTMNFVALPIFLISCSCPPWAILVHPSCCNLLQHPLSGCSVCLQRPV